MDALLHRTDETAYNPFNGGGVYQTYLPQSGHYTPGGIGPAEVDAFRATERTMTTDFRMSKPDVFTIKGGDVGMVLVLKQKWYHGKRSKTWRYYCFHWKKD